MAFKFPFTNYHELNLTWVLDQLKKLFEESAENVSTIQNYDGRLTAVETELPTVSETASEASRAAAAAGTLAQTAKATADTAQENAVQAQSLAGTARQEAQNAQTAADAATQAAQQAQATAQNFDGRITQAQNDASTALEASRSFENRVQAAITTANNAAQTATNAQGIAMRADQNAAIALDTLNSQRAELERIGAEQAALITAETEDKKTEIENLAESVLDSIPEDYTALSNLVDKKAPVIINSASGAVASFDDGADNMKIQKLIVNIEPLQAGSGTPSPNNIRPFSGWTGAEVVRAGNNLFDVSSIEQGTINTTGGNVSTPNRVRSGFVNVGEAIQCILSVQSGYNCDYIFFYDGQKSFISYITAPSNKIFATPDNCKYVRFTFFKINSDTVTPDEITEVQLETGTTATAYKSFTGNKISVKWEIEAGTVYGGPYDIITGKLVSDLYVHIFDGTENFIDAGSGFFRVVYYPEAIARISVEDKICSVFPFYNGSLINAPDNSWMMASVTAVQFRMNHYAGNLDGFKAYIASLYSAGTPLAIGYRLKTPQEFQIAPQEVKTLFATNNIVANTGSVSVDYPADTKLYIDGKLAELQATILENI